MHLPAVEFLLPSSLGTPALQLAWPLRWHILRTPTGCSSWSGSSQWWQTSGWCVLSGGREPKQIKQPSRQPQRAIPGFQQSSEVPTLEAFACCHVSLHQNTSLEWEEQARDWLKSSIKQPFKTNKHRIICPHQRSHFRKFKQPLILNFFVKYFLRRKLARGDFSDHPPF